MKGFSRNWDGDWPKLLQELADRFALGENVPPHIVVIVQEKEGLIVNHKGFEGPEELCAFLDWSLHQLAESEDLHKMIPSISIHDVECCY